MAGKKSSGNKDQRTRNWTFIVYPESAPVNWRDMLDDLHLQWVESPLHDKDINADGELKKPHWHILVMYEGVKSFDQVKEVTDLLNAPIPQKCAAARALVRYMAHLDNPEKVQYSVSDIKGHGGVDINEMLKPSSAERYQLIREMINYIRDNNITELVDLVAYAMNERFEDWFPLLCDNSAYIINSVIKSNKFSLREKDVVSVDPDTGEVKR